MPHNNHASEPRYCDCIVCVYEWVDLNQLCPLFSCICEPMLCIQLSFQILDASPESMGKMLNPYEPKSSHR